MKRFSLLFSLVLPILISAQVGINTDSPRSTLDINGNLSVKVVSLTGNGIGNQTNTGTTVDIDDGVYISINPQVQDDTFELPDPSAVPGRVYFIRNVNPTNTVTAKIVTSAGQLFSSGSTTGGANEIFLYENAAANEYLKSIIVISDGVNWTYFFGLL
ncbi:hypothetical protein [Winogradskyella sp.]|uniref:hypothetical protein n=1 Tax=Winogradskyella sp. TaxID=1883156 RepID=UPI0026239807|nr:hypothetical protein [Winogradskyella sp.]